MAQAFVSTYKNHYRWNCQPRVPLYDPNTLSRLEPEGDVWLLDLNSEIEAELRNLPKIQEAIQRLYLKRMRSTYQVSYCDRHADLLKKYSELVVAADDGSSKDDEASNNHLLNNCNKLFERKNVKIIPPLNTARNVFGYIRPTRLLTPLTVYQNEYDRVGCNILKPNNKTQS